MDSSELLQVLIIEDEPDMASMLKMLLEGELSASVEIAKDYTSAREKFGSTTFDIITLDYKLPDGDGLELLREINSMDGPPPVIMVTGQGDEHIAADSLKLGASGYVVKDHRLSTLLPEAIKVALDRQTAERALRESEERYRSAFDNSKNGIAVYGAVRDGEDFVFKEFNKAAQAIDGISREDVVGKSVLEVFPGVREFGLFEVFQRVWKTGVPEHHPVCQYVDERITGWRDNYVYRLSSGEVVAVYEDVTERKAAVEALREREERLVSAQEIGRIGSWEYDVDSQKIEWSLETYRLYERDPALGPPTEEEEAEYYSEEQVQVLRQYAARAIAEGKDFEYDFEVRLSGGRRAFYSATLQPVKDDGGRVIRLWGTVQDITERKQAEEALREREAFLSAITEGAIDAIILIDNKTIINHWNPAAEKLFGFTAEEAVGQSVAIVAPEPTRQTYMSAIRSFINSGERKLTAEEPTEMLVAEKNGAEFPVEITTSRFQIGDEWYAEVVARDITEQKRAEEEMRKSESQLSLMFANIAEVMFYLSVEPDDRYRFLRVNNSFLNATGLLEKQVVGKYVHEVIPEPSLTLVLEKYKQAIEGNTIVRWEEVTDYPAGLKYGDVAVAPIVDSSGRCTNLLGSVHDMTDRIQDEEALQRVNIELEGYAHTVSHDLKGPLSTASIAFEMLMSVMEKVEMPEEKAGLFREIIGAGRSSMFNAHNIIENLLLLAEEADELQDVAPVSIEETINKVLAENAEMIEEKGITVEVASPLGEVVASPTHIYQLFSNLIRNSIEHNNDKNTAIEISSLGVEDRTHRFLVRDNGQGIPEEILDDVFMRFVKAQSSGSGIGLSIVEKIVKTYGGEIRAYNDNGACIEFTLKDYAGIAST